MPALSPARRSELRAQAHALSPVVMIGDKGLTDTVLAEVDRALKAHELVKVKAATDDREARAAWLEAICAKLAAYPVQAIGKVLVIWRENPKEPEPKKPAKKKGTLPFSERAKPKKKGTLPFSEKKKPGKGKRPHFPRSTQGTDARAEPATGSGRQRSRTPSPLPASEPRRRRPRTSR